jgi:3'5'-cyclic nucleotide phosphodiesterase
VNLISADFCSKRSIVVGIPVATMYQNNPFHNFQHASHVVMSVMKLLSRIVMPDMLEAFVDTAHPGKELDEHQVMAKIHDHTYGITSDPLTQFACVFAALVHDVDHTGVPNGQLQNENPILAEHYQNRSIAEQNSLDLAWNLLMDDEFQDLRHAIYRTDDELRRFRELVVNSVMATDIMDQELKKARDDRWYRAFRAKNSFESPRDIVNRKATIVIEHLIQASDVAHTMQHWQVYRKWNECLFLEMTNAYTEGRSDRSPSEFWYQGELGFFDFYVIPLAKKLKDCGVFGVSSDEYLNYALRNRQEWEENGEAIVASLVERIHNKAEY